MQLIIKGRVPSKKNSRINTRSGRSFPSKKYKEWHEDASWQLYAQKKTKIKSPYKIEITIFPPDDRRWDITNKAESIMDLLVDCGIIEDDNSKIVPEIILHAMPADRIDPRAIIIIQQL